MVRYLQGECMFSSGMLWWWWQHVSLLWWSLLSVRCEVYQEISVLMLKRSSEVAYMVFCLALLCAYAKMSAKLALSSNHGITTFEIGLHHKSTMLSTPGHADNWNGKAYATDRHMTRMFSATTAHLVASWKWVYHSAGPCIKLCTAYDRKLSSQQKIYCETLILNVVFTVYRSDFKNKWYRGQKRHLP